MKSLNLYFILFLFASGFSSLFGCAGSESETSNTQSQTTISLNTEITTDTILTAYASRDSFSDRNDSSLHKVGDIDGNVLESSASFFANSRFSFSFYSGGSTYFSVSDDKTFSESEAKFNATDHPLCLFYSSSSLADDLSTKNPNIDDGFYVKLKARQGLQKNQYISDSHNDWYGRQVWSEIPESWRRAFTKQDFSVSFFSKSQSQSESEDEELGQSVSKEDRYLHCFIKGTKSTLTWNEVAESLGFLTQFQLNNLNNPEN